MSSGSSSATRPKRTAVLVVHGIGNQRARDTVRGIVQAVWLADDKRSASEKKLWTHPEPSGVDIDLPVITTGKTTGKAPGARGRKVDFHELYWAHLMSETKALAVLLWLFELGRKGPKMRPGMNALWWVGAVFLCLLNLSVALIALKAIATLFEIKTDKALSILAPPFLLIISSILVGLAASLTLRAKRLALALAAVCALGAVLGWATQHYAAAWTCGADPDKPVLCALDLTNIALLPIILALLATWLLMGWHGLKAFIVALLLLTLAGLLPLLHPLLSTMSWASIAGRLRDAETWMPWNLNSPRDAVIAWAVVGTYLAVNAAFLQPYLGDAARYFRTAPSNVAVRREIRKQAVDTLAALHTRGRYDRIVVVAHSMGCVVAYDMLRTYFGRVNRHLPGPTELGQSLTDLDNASWDFSKPADREQHADLRSQARKIVARMAQIRDEQAPDTPDDKRPHDNWLVTDFVTLGNALTHAKYLTSREEDGETQDSEFCRHIDERDFPTCPPKRIGEDGLLTFKHETLGTLFHHGAVFGLTRWTNLYFEREQIFWGDAIGGPVADLFGSHILDVPVWTDHIKRTRFFTHNAYWDLRYGRRAPHIVALHKAIDLDDSQSALGLDTTEWCVRKTGPQALGRAEPASPARAPVR